MTVVELIDDLLELQEDGYGSSIITARNRDGDPGPVVALLFDVEGEVYMRAGVKI